MIERARRIGATLGLALGLAGLCVSGAGADPLTVTATAITAFDKNSDTVRFGRLDYLGGFAFSGSDRRLKGISGLELAEDGRRFLAVTDAGSWFMGAIARDAAGRPVGIENAEIEDMVGPDGRVFASKPKADAEGLTQVGDQLFVSFEHDARILAYSGFPVPSKALPTLVPLPVPRRELRLNQGLEAIAASPPDSPLKGAIVTVAEGSIDINGNLFAGIIRANGTSGGIVKLRKDEKWNVSDADFLPNGDLLVMERRFEGLFGGLGIRLRQIPGATIRPGRPIDGPVVFEADLGQEIDNMEGLSIWRDGAGDIRLTMISDDNGSIFQRNLLLEFRWIED